MRKEHFSSYSNNCTTAFESADDLPARKVFALSDLQLLDSKFSLIILKRIAIEYCKHQIESVNYK